MMISFRRHCTSYHLSLFIFIKNDNDVLVSGLKSFHFRLNYICAGTIMGSHLQPITKR